MEAPLPDTPAPPEVSPAPIIPINRAGSDTVLTPLTPPRAIQRIATLPGFLPEPQLRQLLLTQNIVDAPQAFSDIHALWETVRRKRQLLPRRYFPSGNIEGELPAEFASYEKELMQRDVYLRWYQGNMSCRLRLIPVLRLVTPQYFINRDYVDALTTRAPEPGDTAGALTFAFDYGEPIPDPVFDGIGGGALIFRSAETRLVAIQPLEFQRVGPHEVMVIQRIQPRPNLFQVVRLTKQQGIDDLLIVANGVHRAAALILKGWEYVPAIVRTAVTYADLQFGLDLGIFPPPELINLRPPYVLDLLDPELATEFHQAAMEQVAKIMPRSKGSACRANRSHRL
jgi:hypothetical protein